MSLQPIKVRKSEAKKNPNWKNDHDEYVVILNASEEPSDLPIQYTMLCYGATPYIIDLFFDKLSDAFTAWVTLRERTTINQKVEVTEYNRSTRIELVNKYQYEDAFDYVVTKEKFKYL